MSNWSWLFFVLGTILCWGAYGPILHKGQLGLEGNPWKAILCVGGAYFVLAVVVPILILRLQGATLSFPLSGTLFASVAGALGAGGAICIAAALKTGGKPINVMPLVFGCAPLVNIAVSSWLHPPEKMLSPFLYLGILCLAVGAGLVMYFKP